MSFKPESVAPLDNTVHTYILMFHACLTYPGLHHVLDEDARVGTGVCRHQRASASEEQDYT